MRFLRSTCGPRKVGWVLYHYPRRLPAWRMGTFPAMRYANLAKWVNRNRDDIRFEQYRPGADYDAVVFLKMMDQPCQELLAQVHAKGGVTVFDANVNYYERWGDYTWAGASPSDEQRELALFMTRRADQVVADSKQLGEVISQYRPDGLITHIPDNVDTRRFNGRKVHKSNRAGRLIWSGVSVKAGHLLLIKEALAELGATLVVVSEARPPVLDELERHCKVEFRRFSLRRYPKDLLSADIIISPRHLNNAYDICHTEYKISLGMAQGLPAVASPQRSYQDALAAGGGLIADGPDQWLKSLAKLLSDADMRQEMGDRAKATVEQNYSTAVVAQRYADLLAGMITKPAG